MTILTDAQAQFVIEKKNGSTVQATDVSFSKDSTDVWTVGNTGIRLDSVAIIYAETTSFESGDGTEASPFIIMNVEQLKWLSTVVNAQNAGRLTSTTDYTTAHYKIGDDIDMSGESVWTPIGTGYGNSNIQIPDTNMFCGVIDGAGHTIKNMNVTVVPQDSTLVLAGLIGIGGSNCNVTNLNIEGSFTTSGVSADGNVIIGGLCAVSYGAEIAKSTFKGSLTAPHQEGTSASATVGGIVGLQVRGDVNGCAVDIPDGYSFTADAASSCIGGITGNGLSGVIDSCNVYIAGKISSNSTVGTSGQAAAMAGGIGGSLFGSVLQNSKTTVSQTGAIIANGVRETSDEASANAYAGGLAGTYGSDMLLYDTADVQGQIEATADNMVEAAGGVAQIRRAGYGTSGISVNVSGSIKAVSKAASCLSSSDGAYAGGVFGEASYQTSTGATADCDANISGTVQAVHSQAAIVGGIAGSCVNPKRCYSIIDTTGKLLANETSCESVISIGGVTGMVTSGYAMGCYSINKGEIKAASSTKAVTLGGVVGAASGTKYSKKQITACYTLQYGSISGGEEAVIGAVTGLTGRYTTYTSSYWYASDSTLTGHIGGSADETYKLADDSKSSLETAATEMNTVLAEYEAGSYSYSDSYGYLTIKKPEE